MRRHHPAARLCGLVAALALAVPGVASAAPRAAEPAALEAVDPARDRSVPFTHVDLTLMLGGTAVLLAGGLGVRRVTSGRG